MVKQAFYYYLVNRIPAIREKYLNYRNTHPNKNRVISWIYLLLLNISIRMKMFFGKGRYIEESDSIKIIDCESSISFLGSPEKYVKQLLDADIISFDVFDTLILRRISSPTDLFYLIQRSLDYIDFKRIRTDIENQLRYERNKATGDYEVNIHEIWEAIHEYTGIDAKQGIRAEIASEKKICFANPFFLKVVSLLKEEKKKIIICSDMYLGKEYIQEILLHCGYPDFDAIYVSSDYRLSKSDGSLYDLIKKEQGRENTYIHIGDNVHSDVLQAKKHGFQTIPYRNVHSTGKKYRPKDMSSIAASVYSGIVNCHLHSGLKVYNKYYELGFIYGGLLVAGFCRFIHSFSEAHQIQKLIFLSRDGDIIKKAYEIMFPNANQSLHYGLWSRLASLKMCSKEYRSLFFERLIIHKVDQGFSFKEIFNTMELENVLDDFLSSYGNKYNENDILTKDNKNDLIQYMEEKWDQICANYEEEINEGKAYYQAMIGDSRRIAIVDVGWVGSGAITLRRIISDIVGSDSDIYGLLAGTCAYGYSDYDSTAVYFTDGTLNSYLFSAFENRDMWKKHDPVKGHNMIVELLLASDQYSFRGFKKTPAGDYQYNSEKESIDANEIQAGIIEFVKIFHQHPFFFFFISGRDAMAPISILYNNKDYINDLLMTSGIKACIE